MAAATLATARDRVEMYLGDSSNLTYSTDTLDEAIRSALAEISVVHGTALTLNGLDSASATTLPALDEFALIIGAVAFALQFRNAARLEDAMPQAAEPDSLILSANKFRSHFNYQLKQIKRRLLQESSDHPHSEWDWDEEYSWDDED
jgi:hypothetical protein